MPELTHDAEERIQKRRLSMYNETSLTEKRSRHPSLFILIPVHLSCHYNHP